MLSLRCRIAKSIQDGDITFIVHLEHGSSSGLLEPSVVPSISTSIDLVAAWWLNIPVDLIHSRCWFSQELCSCSIWLCDFELPVDGHVSLLELDDTGSLTLLSQEVHSGIILWILMQEARNLFLFPVGTCRVTFVLVLVVPFDFVRR